MAKGMTLRDVAAACWDEHNCKIDPSNLSRAEKGATNQLSPSKVPALLKVLGLTIEELIPGEGKAAA